MLNLVSFKIEGKIIRLLTTSSDCVIGRDVTVLAVHVVASSARVVSQPDTVVLDALCGVRLLDLLYLDDLTIGLLDLLETSQKVPETRLGDDLIGCKDGHAVQGRVRVELVHQVAAHNSVLTQLENRIDHN